MESIKKEISPLIPTVLGPDNQPIPYLNAVVYKKREEIGLHTLSSEYKIILDMYNYFWDNFAYWDMRRELVEAFNFWLEVPNDRFERNCEFFKIMQTADLMNNDITFEKTTRQGIPSAHVRFGISQVLNAYYLSGLPGTWVLPEYLHKVIPVLNEQSRHHYRKRHLILNARVKVICPKEELYLELCGNKGALSFVIREIEMLQLVYSTKRGAFKEFAEKIRTFLTIVDECRRIAVKNGEDITETFFSFPIMYVINNRKDEDEIILNIMRQRTSNPEIINGALTVLHESDCFERAKEKLNSLKEKILQQYKQFDKNPLMDTFFEKYLQVPEDFASVAWVLS